MTGQLTAPDPDTPNPDTEVRGRCPGCGEAVWSRRFTYRTGYDQRLWDVEDVDPARLEWSHRNGEPLCAEDTVRGIQPAFPVPWRTVVDPEAAENEYDPDAVTCRRCAGEGFVRCRGCRGGTRTPARSVFCGRAHRCDDSCRHWCGRHPEICDPAGPGRREHCHHIWRGKGQATYHPGCPMGHTACGHGQPHHEPYEHVCSDDCLTCADCQGEGATICPDCDGTCVTVPSSAPVDEPAPAELASVEPAQAETAQATPQAAPAPVRGEITGLKSALQFAAAMAAIYREHHPDAQVFPDVLRGCGGVSGEAIAAAVQAAAAVAAAALAWRQAHQALAEQLHVAEAYAAAPGAGSREFVTGS